MLTAVFLRLGLLVKIVFLIVGVTVLKAQQAGNKADKNRQDQNFGCRASHCALLKELILP